MTGEGTRRPGPIVFISHFRVKEGKLDGYREFLRRGVRALEAEKPRTVVFLAYADDQSGVTIVHVFGDAEAMDLHFEGAQERAKLAYEFLEPQGWEIYGAASAVALEMLRGTAAAAGVTLTVLPEHLGGFLRPGSG